MNVIRFLLCMVLSIAYAVGAFIGLAVVLSKLGV